MSTTETIRDAAGVDELVRAARAAGRMALDFEFLWERTYAPLPCLAQVAIDGRILLVDPIEGAPLEPISALVSDPSVTVVMHAPSADLTLMALATGVAPAALEDVQLTAGFVGLGAGQGLSVLLERVLKVRLDKAERYTDWSKRPLSGPQNAYAAADVAHLLQLADDLNHRAQRLDRSEWVAEEHLRRYGPEARFTTDPDRAWRRVKGQGRLNGRDRAVLAALAAWREHEARTLNRPTSWVIPDRTLVEIARRRPGSRRALENERGLPDRIRGADAERVMEAIRTGERAEPITMGSPPAADVQARAEALAPLGAALVAARAEAVDLAPSLLATRDDIQGFLAAAMAGDGAEHLLGTGWRYRLAGESLERLAAGELALVASPTRPYLRELPTTPTDPSRSEA